MEEKCPDCLDGTLQFEGPCPSCGRSGSEIGQRRKRTAKDDVKIRAKIKELLASEDWAELVDIARDRLVLPRNGFSSDEGEAAIAGAGTHLMSLYLTLNPTSDYALRLANELFPEGGESNREDDKEEKFKALSQESGWLSYTLPDHIIGLRIEACYLADWLGVSDDEAPMMYLLSPERWPLTEWQPVIAERQGQALQRTMMAILQAVLPISDTRSQLKRGILNEFVERSGVKNPRGPGHPTWPEATTEWNRMFPFWRVNHWRNLYKAYHPNRSNH